MPTDLITYAQNLTSQLGDPLAPPLLVALEALSDADKNTLESDAYDYRPYAIITNLPNTLIAGMDDKRAGVFNGTVDVLVRQERKSLDRNTNLNLIRVANQFLNAPENVDEIVPGYVLREPLQLVFQQLPMLVDYGSFSGIQMILSFDYHIAYYS